MNTKKILVVVGFVVLVAVVYWQFSAKNTGCPKRNPNKFKAWDEEDIPFGHIKQIAQIYADPILGADDSNASLVAGFFKGINVRATTQAAKYYKDHLIEYLNSEDTYPHWNMEQGELLC